jgi:MIP family channel proteins
MDTALRRALAAELLGTFALVWFSAGAVCVNAMAATASGGALSPQQPGTVGIAVAQGLIYAAVLAVTVRVSGGFLNPAVTLMLWVFNRLDNKRTGVLLLGQLIGAFLAATCLRFTFADDVLQGIRLGTPHLNPLAFPSIETSAILAGTAAELVLTFFLVFAIFGAQGEGREPARAALPAGLVLVAGTLVVGPLTGAAANPARWLGTVIWEQLLHRPDMANPWNDTFVYLAGPILGALAGGVVTFRFLLNESPVSAPPAAASAQLPLKTPPATAVKRK